MKWEQDYVAQAAQRQRIVAGFNVFGYEDAQAVIRAAERADAPVLLMLNRDARAVMAIEHWAALLNSLQMGFRSLAIEQRSSEVWKLLGAVKNDFARFADVLEKTQQRLRQATESIDTAFVRTRTIQRRLGQVEAADATLFPGEADFTLVDSPEDAQ